MNDDGEHTLNEWIKSHKWTAVIVTFLTILLAIILNELQARIKWFYFVISLVLIFTIFIATMWLVLSKALKVFLSLSKTIKLNIEALLRRNKLGWIFTTPQLLDYESNIFCHEIWLISSDLRDDVKGGPFYECVANNLKKGIRYRYFVPNTLSIHSKVEQIKIFNKKDVNLSIVYLNDDFFFLVPRFDFTIYNPLNQPENVDRIAFMGIPISDEECQYHAKITDDVTDVIIGKLLPLIKVGGE